MPEVKSLKVKLQIVAFLIAVFGSAICGVWAAIHFDNPALLLLCIPAFAATWAGF